MRGAPSPTVAVLSELERERQRGIFVMHNFVPPNQRGNLDFITQQLRRSPIPPDFALKTYFTATSSPVDENSEDWQDLMLWSQPSLLDTLESRPLHLFQWDRTHSYLSDLKAALLASATLPSPKFEKQRRWIRSCMQLLQKNMPSLRPHRFPTEVRWVIWKLRRLLAAIPTSSSNQAAMHAEDVRLLRFQVDIGVGPWPKLNVLILNDNPDQFLMFLTALSFLATPPSPQPQGQGQLQPQ